MHQDSMPSGLNRNQIMIALLSAFVFTGLVYILTHQQHEPYHLNNETDGHSAGPANDNITQEEINRGDPKYGRCKEGGYHSPYFVTYGAFTLVKCRKCENLIFDLPI